MWQRPITWTSRYRYAYPRKLNYDKEKHTSNGRQLTAKIVRRTASNYPTPYHNRRAPLYQHLAHCRSHCQRFFLEHRGWTYQEALLSRRRLCFTDEQVYFECESMYCYEVFDAPVGAFTPPPNEPLQIRNIREAEHLLRIFPQRINKTKIHVFDMIEQYSRRSLTNPTDRLNGFLGILEAYQISPYGLQSFWGTPIAQNNTRLLYSEHHSIQTDEEKHSMTGFISGNL
jgi:hypothetical protein